jgi:hypothetical protein
MMCIMRQSGGFGGLEWRMPDGGFSRAVERPVFSVGRGGGGVLSGGVLLFGLADDEQQISFHFKSMKVGNIH